MPLNLKDEENDQASSPGPVLHQPGDGKPVVTKWLIIIFVGVIIGAAVYFAYKSNVFRKRAANPPPPAGSTEQRLTAAPEGSPQQEPSAATSERSEPATGALGKTDADQEKKMDDVTRSLRKRATSSPSGNYTIYIGRHRSREVADEEAGRWDEAGYDTFVTELDGWYRVSVGRYLTWDEAKSVAQKLKDGMEAGYMIGKVAE